VFVKVSTIIPAFNAERTIAHTIESALAQEHDGQEIVVVNDGSTDSTASVLKKYGSKVRVITQPNRGSAVARSVGIFQSNGTYIALLDSDDTWLPSKLAKVVSALERNPRASLAFSEFQHVSETGIECGGSSIGHAPSMEELLERLPPILPSTWVVRRTMFERIGGFCEAFEGAEGFEHCWPLMLLRELGEFEYVPEKLTLYRVGDSSKSAEKYGRGLPIFIDLVKKRYRAKGGTLIRAAKNLECRWMLSKMAHQMNCGDRLGALATLGRIARLRPAYFLTSEFTERLLLPQNLKRVIDLGAMLGRTRSQN
jgi:glycosyltransferase involved in cell wall biosynthesis